MTRSPAGMILLASLLAGSTLTADQPQDSLEAISIETSAVQTDCSAEQLTKDNAVILLDLHGLLIQSSTKELASVLRDHMLCKPSTWFSMLRTVVQLPIIGWQAHQCIKNRTRVAEGCFEYLLDDYPHLQALEPLFYELANAQPLLISTQKVVKELRDAGYRVCIFSNIGPKIFAHLQERHAFLASFKPEDIITASKDEQGRWMAKPQEKAYRAAVVQLKLKPGTRLIFFDDKKRNVLQANRLRHEDGTKLMDAYQVRSGENSGVDIRAKLEELDILTQATQSA